MAGMIANQKTMCAFDFPGRYEHVNGILRKSRKERSTRMHPVKPRTNACPTAAVHGQNHHSSTVEIAVTGIAETASSARRVAVRVDRPSGAGVTRNSQLARSSTGNAKTVRGPSDAAHNRMILATSIGVFVRCRRSSPVRRMTSRIIAR